MPLGGSVMNTDPDTEPARIDAAVLLPVPDLARVSDPQFRGAACVWCGVILAPATAVDLGERRIRRLDRHATVRPRGCRLCVAEHLPAVQQGHAGTCEACVDNPAGGCEIGGGLRRLELSVTR